VNPTTAFLIAALLFTTFANTTSKEITSSIAEATVSLSTSRPIRVGVLPFTPTQDQYAKSNAFGEFIAEQTAITLMDNPEKVRLFEREKLSTVAEELALNQSNMIDADQAIALGGVIPVDFLITGSYTKINEKIDLSFRILDVITGEVMRAGNDQIASEKFAELFNISQSENSVTTEKIVVTIDTAKADTVPECEKEWWPTIKFALHDLSSDSSIAEVIKPAVQIPFDTSCEHLHGAILREFSYYKIFNKEYARYLTEQLNDIAAIDYLREALTVQRYLLQNGMGDESDWKLWSSLAETSRYPKSYLRKLLKTDTLTEESYRVGAPRTEELAQTITEGKLGKPQAFETPEGFRFFSELFKITSSETSKGDEHRILKNRIAFDLYNLFTPEKWAIDLSQKPAREYWYSLRYTVDRAIAVSNSEIAKLEKRMIKLWKTVEPNETSAKEYFYYLNYLSAQSSNEKLDPAMRKLYSDHYSSIVASTKKEFSQFGSLATDSRVRNTVISRSLKEGIKIAGFPTVEELAIQLSGNSSNSTLFTTVTILEDAGTAAAPATSRLLRMLGRSERLDLKDPALFRQKIIRTLGNCSIDDSATVMTLIPYLLEEGAVSDATKEALAKGDESTLSTIMNEYSTQSVSVQIMLIETVSKMEQIRERVLQFLSKEYNRTGEILIKDAIEDAEDLL
jgi:hypothetical protein